MILWPGCSSRLPGWEEEALVLPKCSEGAASDRFSVALSWLVIATPGVLHSEQQPAGKKVVPTTRGGAVNYGSSCFKQGGGHPGKICRSSSGLFAGAELLNNLKKHLLAPIGDIGHLLGAFAG